MNEISTQSRKKTWILVGAILLAGAFFLLPRHSPVAAKSAAPSEAIPVAVAKVERRDIGRELVFESEFKPYQEVDLHAKVAGYLESITVDIGDHVKEGQVLATLEIPELESDMEHAI